MRFLWERDHTNTEGQGDAKEAESIVQSITSTLLIQDADRILEQINMNTQQVFKMTKDRQKQKFESEKFTELRVGSLFLWLHHSTIVASPLAFTALMLPHETQLAHYKEIKGQYKKPLDQNDR